MSPALTPTHVTARSPGSSRSLTARSLPVSPVLVRPLPRHSPVSPGLSRSGLHVTLLLNQSGNKLCVPRLANVARARLHVQLTPTPTSACVTDKPTPWPRVWLTHTSPTSRVQPNPKPLPLNPNPQPHVPCATHKQTHVDVCNRGRVCERERGRGTGRERRHRPV